MNDRERIVEVMTKAALFFDLDETQKHAEDLVERQLAALEADGYAIYRPDECSYTTVTAELKDGSGYCWFGYQPAGTYHLVPSVWGRADA